MDTMCIHWSAGQYVPNEDAINDYHYLIGYDVKKDEGIIYPGRFKPEDNLICYDGVYAHHCGGGNTKSIGLAFCGMLGYKGPARIGNYPLMRKQLEKGFSYAADRCLFYKIPIVKEKVYTHFEFGLLHPETSSRGKIDINFIPGHPDIKPHECGDYIREKILWYSKR